MRALRALLVVLKIADGSWFTVTIDRAPYLRDAPLSHGPAPAVGSVVVLEDWNGRLVSVFDLRAAAVNTGQWPSPRRDMLEPVGALAVLLAAPGLPL